MKKFFLAFLFLFVIGGVSAEEKTDILSSVLSCFADRLNVKYLSTDEILGHLAEGYGLEKNEQTKEMLLNS